jgi:hypothetical protein
MTSAGEVSALQQHLWHECITYNNSDGEDIWASACSDIWANSVKYSTSFPVLSSTTNVTAQSSSSKQFLWFLIFQTPFSAQVERLLLLSCISALTRVKSKLINCLSRDFGVQVNQQSNAITVTILQDSNGEKKLSAGST